MHLNWLSYYTLIIRENLCYYNSDIYRNFIIMKMIKSEDDDIRSYRKRLRTLHRGDTPNNAIDYDDFLDIYDVFN